VGAEALDETAELWTRRVAASVIGSHRRSAMTLTARSDARCARAIGANAPSIRRGTRTSFGAVMMFHVAK
jgi:hypothetical protein